MITHDMPKCIYHFLGDTYIVAHYLDPSKFFHPFADATPGGRTWSLECDTRGRAGGSWPGYLPQVFVAPLNMLTWGKPRKDADFVE